MRYSHASGTSLYDCVFLAHGPATGAVVAVRRAPPESATPLDVGLRLEGAFTGLWRSPSGQVWATDRDGVVWHARALWGPEAGKWTRQDLDLDPGGVVGAADDAVFVWGTRRSDGACLVRGWDGRSWKPFPSPPFAVLALDVRAGLVAVGEDGWFGRLDGPQWTVVHTGTSADLLAVDGSERQVVAGAADGSVLVGDITGFSMRFRVPGPALAVARWQGALWAGAGEHGLFREGALVRDDRRCNALEAHDELLVGCDDVVCSTPNGARFPAAGRGVVESPVRLEPRTWR